MGPPNSIEIRSAGSQTLQSATGGISLLVADGEEINIKNSSTGAVGTLAGNIGRSGNVNISSKYRDINITNENALDPLDPVATTNAIGALTAAVAKGMGTVLVPHGPILPSDGITFMDNLVFIFYVPATDTWDFGVGLPPMVDPVTKEAFPGKWSAQGPIGKGLMGLDPEDQDGWGRFVTYFSIAYKQGSIFITAGQGLQLERTEGNIILHCAKKISIVSDDEINIQAMKDIKIHSLMGNVDITATNTLNFQGLVGANIQGPKSGINMEAVTPGVEVMGSPPIPIIPGVQPVTFIPLDKRIPDVDLVKKNANGDPIEPVMGFNGKPLPHVTLDPHQHYEPIKVPETDRNKVGK